MPEEEIEPRPGWTFTCGAVGGDNADSAPLTARARVGTPRTMIGALDETASARVAAHYDDLDDFYRDVWGLHVHHGLFLDGRETVREATEALVRLVMLRARARRGASIADVGCGYGETARMLARDLGARVTALTISEKQRAWCGETDNPRFLLADWLARPLDAASQDAVIAIESTEHMPDLGRFFGEAARVLKPGGTVVVCAWLASDSMPASIERHVLGKVCEEGELCLRTRHEHERAMHGAKLAPASFEDLTRKVSRTWTLCIARALRGLVTDPRYASFLFTSRSESRRFVKSLLRIRIAYALRAMRYGLFVATKPTS